MANEPSKTPTQATPQMIPLSKLHELPGVFNPKPQDKSLGSMVLSIQNSGVKEAVILWRRKWRLCFWKKKRNRRPCRSGASRNSGQISTDDFAGLFKGFGVLPQQAETAVSGNAGNHSFESLYVQRHCLLLLSGPKIKIECRSY